jgi:hypothetical protein
LLETSHLIDGALLRIKADRFSASLAVNTNLFGLLLSSGQILLGLREGSGG